LSTDPSSRIRSLPVRLLFLAEGRTASDQGTI
jgi:hypothetical protein